MGLSIERLELLLLVAAVVAIVARQLRLPYTVGLVLAGTVLAFLPTTSSLTLTKDLIFSAFLPPLIFEAAFQMHLKELRRDLPVTLTLATFGLLLAAGLTAAGIHFLLGWEWQTALLLGVLISATDPVSVIAAFKEAGVQGRVRMLVEAESLFNDGTVAVLFSVILALTAGAAFSLPQAVLSFLLTFFGGILAGVLVGGATLLLAGRTDDPLVEITFTTVAAYGAFLGAEHFHLSGVMATLASGILLGNYGHMGAITDKGREAVIAFWEFAAFVANSLIFLLIGVRLTHQHFEGVWLSCLVVLGLVLMGRAVTVYGCSPLFMRSRLRVPLSIQHILFWGGLRGALALALVFGLPPNLPRRDLLTTVVFAVVAFSVIVQGLTMPLLLRRLGVIGASALHEEK